jgi:hypothetical protein
MGGRTGKTIRLESSSPSNSIYQQSSYGPTFGSGHDLHVSSSMKSSSNSCSPSSYRTVTRGSQLWNLTHLIVTLPMDNA